MFTHPGHWINNMKYMANNLLEDVGLFVNVCTSAKSGKSLNACTPPVLSLEEFYSHYQQGSATLDSHT